MKILNKKKNLPEEKYPKEMLLNLYRTMVRIRSFEEHAAECFTKGMLAGNIHLSIGQEGAEAGAFAAIGPQDYFTSTHRGHGHAIARGADAKLAMAELFGKETGYCKGKGGSMHIADFTKGNLGANAIVGGGIPIAVGAGLASKMQKNDRVAVSFFGDSATNEGTFHESLNLAAVWKLPVIFVCENNLYGISVPQWQSTSVKDISVRGEAYNIPHFTVDGNKPDEIAPVVEAAIARAKAGEGPTLIECKTYRWLGHWTGDPQPYRTKEEIEEWKKKCPIKYTRNLLLEMGVPAEELDGLENKAQALVDEAEQFALNSPEPDPAHVLDDVFYDGGDR